jgi:hypothetical protein
MISIEFITIGIIQDLTCCFRNSETNDNHDKHWFAYILDGPYIYIKENG